MIRGARFWNDRNRYSVQTNNPTEEQLRKAGVGGWLETCGPTAAVNCLDALGVNLVVTCPGLYRPQPEEVLSDYLNDPRNYDKLIAARKDVDPSSIPNNRVPQDYPVAVREVFAAEASFSWGATWAAVTAELCAGKAVQITLKKPGHFLALVAFDDVAQEIIFDDSWPARVGGDGFNRRMGQEEFESNVQPFRIVYGVTS
jgi:sugar phosphate isomerase/epimerase